MMIYRHSLILLLFFASFNIGVDSLFCYQCDKIENNACGDPFSSSDAYARDCSVKSANTTTDILLTLSTGKFESTCVKSIANFKGDISTFRGCSYSGDDTCEIIKSAVEADGGNLEHCSICSNENLCNFTPSLRISLSLFIINVIHLLF